MRSASAAVLCLAGSLQAQEAYFKPEENRWWMPTWSALVTTEHFHLGDDDPPDRFDRTRGLLRLRWAVGAEDDPFRVEAGVVGYLGSDGNRNNLPRQDNERSNGGQLDVAALRLLALRPAGGLEVRAGLLENPLLSSESLWDKDLRVIGGGGRAFWRSEDGAVEEAGIRGVDGEVRLLEGGRVKIRAGQGVLRIATGPLTWTGHADVWRLEARPEDATSFLRSNPGPGGYVDPDGGPAYEDTRFTFHVVGLGVTYEGELPFELKALRHDNQETPGRGEELQAWLGSPTQVWHWQAGYIRQRLDAAGALASVNGDQWWFHANADGERYALALNLPQRWRVQADYVQQRRRDSPGAVTRTGLSLMRRF